MRDAIGEVDAIAEQGYPLTHIALTGGEPLLFRQESIAFFQAVQQKLPLAHSRLYTAGDRLDRSTALALAKAGLQEIRFSIKIDDLKNELLKFYIALL
ncbi:radical SAM protein [Providencia hangzhouensis]|uniref:radical SAM protein n=1 Tax=Providencia hangzhouensis TaxID=3031799 RepID=UPI0034DDB9E6